MPGPSVVSSFFLSKPTGTVPRDQRDVSRDSTSASLWHCLAEESCDHRKHGIIAEIGETCNVVCARTYSLEQKQTYFVRFVLCI